MTDFIDDDLLRRQDLRRDGEMPPPAQPGSYPQPAPVRHVPAPVPVRAPAPAPGYRQAPAPVPVPRPAVAPTMSRPKDAVEDQVASAMKELERLRQQQENLQTQKSDLEELRRKQQAFEKGRKEMLDALSQSLITLEKEELKIEQLGTLLSNTRNQYKTRLAEIEATAEDKWSDDNYREELNKALALIEDTQSGYRKSQARIATMKEKELGLAEDGSPSVSYGLGSASREDKPFGYWVKMGLGLSLPFMVLFFIMTLVLILYLVGVV